MYVVYVLEQRVRKPPTDNVPCQQNYFQTNCENVIPMLLRSMGIKLGQFVWT